MMLGIGLRAAGTISGERDRQTLDSLLMTTLSNRTLIFDKWLGSILSVRKGWWVLGPIWGLALLSNGIHILALPLLLAGWLSYAAFAAGLGMWFSLTLRSTLSASIATVATIVVAGIAPWGVWSLFVGLWYPNPVPHYLEWVGDFNLYGLTPPVTLGVLAFRGSELVYGQNASPEAVVMPGMIYSAISGVACYGLAAVGLWQTLLRRFGPVTGRMPVETRRKISQNGPAPAPADEAVASA
jgi:ABC-type transport system involved in multi-copper enzyme maturation permease subunit